MTAENFKKNLLRLKSFLDGSIFDEIEDPEKPGLKLRIFKGTRIQLLEGKTVSDYQREAKKEVNQIAESLKRGNIKGEKDEERIALFQEVFKEKVEKEEKSLKPK